MAYPRHRCCPAASLWLGLSLLLASAIAGANEEEVAAAQTGNAAATRETLAIYIEGVEDAVRENVLAYLSIGRLAGERLFADSPLDLLKNITPSAESADTAATPPAAVYTVTVDEDRLRWLHNRAERDIQQALEPFGYYQPTIDASLQNTSQGWTATYRVDPGPPVRIAKLDITILGQGADDPAFEKAIADFPLAEGDVLKHAAYEQLKKDLQLIATERGYFDASLKTGAIRVNLQQNSADIILRYDAGTRYRFGPMQFPEDIPLDAAFLQRFVEFQVGEPYASEALLNLQGDLINSNYFRQVAVEAPPEQAVDYAIPIIVKLTMREPNQYLFGLGYGTDTGVRGKIGYNRRWLNRRGHYFRSELLGSQIRFGLGLEYLIPGADPNQDLHTFFLTATREDSVVKDTENVVTGYRWKRNFGLWQRILELSYGVETFRFSNSGEDQTSKLLLPSVTWIYSDAARDFNVTEGKRFELRLRGAYEPLLSDLSFIQPTLRGKLIQKVGSKFRVIVRSDVGATTATEFRKLPASLRFYAGGDNSVRGYELDKIGPENDEGDVIGGKYLVVGSLELEYRFLEKWSAAVFVDSGDAFDEDLDLKTGVGFGVRWRSPVGPVRIDIAHALDRTPGDLIRLHFNIGPEL